MSKLTFNLKHEYILPESAINELKKNKIITDNRLHYVFSFRKFKDYDEKYHGKALSWMFEEVKLVNKFVGRCDELTMYEFSFNDYGRIIKGLNEGQIMFLCGILHALKCKTYLAALIKVVKKLKISAKNVQEYVTKDIFDVDICYK